MAVLLSDVRQNSSLNKNAFTVCVKNLCVFVLLRIWCIILGSGFNRLHAHHTAHACIHCCVSYLLFLKTLKTKLYNEYPACFWSILWYVHWTYHTRHVAVLSTRANNLNAWRWFSVSHEPIPNAYKRPVQNELLSSDQNCSMFSVHAMRRCRPKCS